MRMQTLSTQFNHLTIEETRSYKPEKPVSFFFDPSSFFELDAQTVQTGTTFSVKLKPSEPITDVNAIFELGISKTYTKNNKQFSFNKSITSTSSHYRYIESNNTEVISVSFDIFQIEELLADYEDFLQFKKMTIDEASLNFWDGF